MYSMTGFGRADATVEKGLLVVELQSVNRKHLDIVISLPKELSSFEVLVRKMLQKGLERGQVTARFFFSVEGYNGLSEEDLHSLKHWKHQWEHVASALGVSKEEITLPFLLEQIEKSGLQSSYTGKEWEKTLTQLTQSALKALISMREKEGVRLKKDLLKSLKMIEKSLEKIVKRSPIIEKNLRSKLEKKLEEFAHLSDQEERLRREAAFYLTKMDIQEEITRLYSHLEETESLLFSSKKSVGKEMEFLLREMSREIHTASVKSSDQITLKNALVIKAELERIKEQIQNVQ